MGWLGDLCSAGVSLVKSVFGDDSSSKTHNSTSNSTSNTQTIYEPDRVKVAELENGKMDRAIEAQKEIIQMNSEMQLMIMEAHQKGFEHSTKILKEMMQSLNQIAQERLTLIEHGHFEVVEKIEKLYLGLENEIREGNDRFNMSQLPSMLEMLSKFEAGSASARLYEKSVDKQIELNGTFFTHKLAALHERQKLMVMSAIQSKEQVLEQSSQIVLDRMKFLDQQLEHQQNMPCIPNQPQPMRLDVSNPDDIEVKSIEEK
ncbi:MAG: hypothetical protein Q9M28_11020 [Mariprofundaceae bacterium]|nr:hypothetical protein [Mariprofundaceae bacterium]